LNDVAVDVAGFDEAVFVASMAHALAAAEARHVAHDFRVLGRELIGGFDDFRRARRRVAGKIERGQIRLRMRLQVGRERPIGNLKSGGCSARLRLGRRRVA